MINRNSRLQLTAPSSAQGAQLIQKADDNAADSRWRLTPTGSGAYTLAAVSDGLLADVSGASTSAGAPVIQWASAPTGPSTQLGGLHSSRRAPDGSG